MSLYLATSCFQGRQLSNAVNELQALAPNGIQLCPGNVVDCGPESIALPTRTHHGFSWRGMRQPVWSEYGKLLVAADSVHPPESGSWWLTDSTSTYEVMYPSYHLGNGDAVELAMRDSLSLAVDVSHVFIQLTSGAMNESEWKRLQNYDRIAEVHVSANSGTRDTHQQLASDTFGLDWVRDKLRAGTVTVLECYMHRLTADERKQQIELVRGK